VFAADVPGCVLTALTWRIAMRLRFGLPVTPALPEEAQLIRSCQVVNQEGGQCCASLDEWGHHACTCQKGSQQLVRHAAIVRELGRQLRRRGLFVREEQWVEALTKRVVEWSEDGIQVTFKEARLDLVVRDGARLWWLDFTCFHPFIGGVRRGHRANDWSLESREKMKHGTYCLRSNSGTRQVANGRVVPVVANSYAAIGKEATSFFQHANSVARRLGRSCANDRLEPFVQSLVVYFVASGVLDAYSGRIVRPGVAKAGVCG